MSHLGGILGAKNCLNCKEPLLAGFLSCPSCGEEVLVGSFLDSQSHLLHGVIHCNGYSHLLQCINGREKGSNFASNIWRRYYGPLGPNVCNASGQNHRHIYVVSMSLMNGEVAILPPHATVRDLKLEAERAFRETYYIMHSFCIESIPDLQGEDEDLLFGAIESGSHVRVDGSGIDSIDDWRYEGGIDSWIVDCPCGTKDDDGERMIACHVCEVWQHTRCGGISGMDSIPQRFLCHRCGVNLFHY